MDFVLELASRTGADVMDIIDLAATDEEAETVLAVLDELDAKEHASDIASRLRRAGHVL